MLLTKIAQFNVWAALIATMMLTQLQAKETNETLGYYHTKMGTINITALYDGSAPLPVNIFKGSDDTEKARLLNQVFLDINEPLQTSFNGFLVETNDQNLTLISTGAADCFGDTLGQIPQNLAKSGYKAEDVTQVIITHLHPDHVCGLVQDGQKSYPNATVYVSAPEADYWLSVDAQNEAPDEIKPYFAQARVSLLPYQQDDQLILIKEGESISPNISIVPSYGHTPGHINVMVSDNEQSVLMWGDTVHNYAMQLPNPDISIEFDRDQTLAIQSRKAILKDAATKGYWIAGAHMPFPGIGRIYQEDDQQYRWVPIQFSQEMK